MFTIVELFDNCTAYKIFVADPKGIRDRKKTTWCNKDDGAKCILVFY